MIFRWPDFKKGDPIPAAWGTDVSRAVAKLLNTRGAEPITVSETSTGFIVGLSANIPKDQFWVNISGTVSGGFYHYQELSPAGATGTAGFEVKANGRTSTNRAIASPAMEAMGNTSVPTGSGTAGARVLLSEFPGTNGFPKYIFTYAATNAGSTTLGIARLTSYDATNGWAADVLVSDGVGGLATNGASISNAGTNKGIFELNTSKGMSTLGGTNSTVVLYDDEKNVFLYGVRLANGTAHLGHAGGLGFATSCASFAFEIGAGGTQVANINHTAGSGTSSNYLVLQINSGNAVWDWVRGHA